MPRKQTLTQKQSAFIQAFMENNAVIYTALKESGVKPSELEKWLDKSPLFADEYRMAELKAVAVVEERVFEIIQSKNLIDSSLIKFYLTTRGGYVDSSKQEKKKTKDTYELEFG